MKNRNIKPELLFFSILSVFTIIYFFRIIFLRYYFFEDFLYQYYPRRNLLATSLRDGVFPLWNPFVFGGMPYLGDIENAVFYPLNWILLFFISNGRLIYRSLEIVLIIHVFMAGAFMYLFSRRMGISHEASTLISLGFAFSGFIISHTIHLTLLSTFVYLPLILYFILRAFQEKRIVFSLLAGFFLGVSLLAGGPQFWLHIVYYSGAFSIFMLVGKGREWKRFIIIPVILYVAGIGISAVQFLTTSGYAAYTVRESITYSESVRNSIPFYQLLTLFIPKFFGFVSGMGKEPVKFWAGGYGAFWETCIYVGIIPLILILYALKRGSKRRKALFFAILSGIFLFAAMGKYTPVYWLFYHILPGFNKFRNAGRFSGLFTFSILMLAGIGFDNLKEKKISQRPILYFLSFYGLIFLLIVSGAFKGVWRMTGYGNAYNYGVQQTFISLFIILISTGSIYLYKLKKKERWTYLIPVLVLFIDLYIFGSGFNISLTNPDDFYGENRLVEFLKTNWQKEPFRINARKGPYMLLRRNSGDIYRLELLQGYTPLRLKLYRDLRMLPEKTYLDLWGAKYTIKIEGKKMGLALNASYLPRAKMYFRWKVMENDAAYQLLKNGWNGYRDTILISHKPEIVYPDSVGHYEVSYMERGINSVKARVVTDLPGVLFVSILDVPGWNARVDGKEARTIKAFYAFTGIVINRGEHIVELSYSPPGMKKGLMFTLLTLVVILILLGGLSYTSHFKE